MVGRCIPLERRVEDQAQEQVKAVIDDEQSIGRVDLHYTATLVHATLCVPESFTQDDIQDLIEAIDEELIDAVILLINSPESTLDDILEIVQGPDFPTAGIALVGTDREQVKHAYGEGHGRITVHARTVVEEGSRGRTQLVITELPFQVNKASLIEKIADLVRDKKIEGIADLRDESDRDGLRVVLELKREGSYEQIKNLLYKHTSMRSTFAINMMAIQKEGAA